MNDGVHERIRLMVLFAVAIRFALPGATAEAAGEEKLLFLGNRNIAPVVYLENGAPAGVAVDIVRAVARYLSKPVEVRATDWQEAQALVVGGHADALIQINATEERKKIYDFSDSLLESRFSIFVASDRVGVSGISSLRGLRVGVEGGGLPRQLLEKNPHVLLTVIPNFLAGFKLLDARAIDAIVVDERVGSYVLAVNGIRNIRVSGEPISFSYSSIAVRKGNAALLDEINRGLRAIKSDGTYNRILDKWKPKETVFRTREQLTRDTYRVAVAALGASCLIVVFWLVTLRRELRKRRAAEETVKGQYSTLRSIIDSANALIFSVDRQYRYTSFNQAHALVMKALYGVAIELGHSLLDYMTVPEDREVAKSNLDRALGGEQHVEESYSGEELLSRQFFQVSHSPVRAETGEVIGVAVLAHDMTERKRAEEALRRLNRELRAISDCNQVLVRAEDEQTLLNDICRIICDEAGYRMAWVGYAEEDDAKTVRPVARAGAGADNGYLAEANITWADTERGWGPAGTAVRTGAVVNIQDFATDPRMAPWRESALQRGYRSGVGLPLKDENGHAFGVLLIYSSEPNAFTPNEVRLMEELAGDLAFGIATQRMRAEQKKVETQILASERLFRALVENSPDFIARYDLEYRRVYVNPAIQKLFGGQPGDALGKTPADRSPIYAPQVYTDHLRQAIETATENAAEIPFRTAEGEMHWGQIRFVPEFGPDGQVVSVLAIGRDIHEIKESEQRFRMLAESFPDFVVRFDRDGQYTYVNPAVERAFGVSAEAIVGKTLRGLPQRRKPEQNEALLALIRRAFDNGVPNESEVVWDTERGERIFEIRHAPEKDATGNVVSVLSIARDITERRVAEGEIRRLNEELEQRVKERTAELEAKNRELERLNKLFVGRELRMVELKKRIKELERQEP